MGRCGAQQPVQGGVRGCLGMSGLVWLRGPGLVSRPRTPWLSGGCGPFVWVLVDVVWPVCTRGLCISSRHTQDLHRHWSPRPPPVTFFTWPSTPSDTTLLSSGGGERKAGEHIETPLRPRPEPRRGAPPPVFGRQREPSATSFPSGSRCPLHPPLPCARRHLWEMVVWGSSAAGGKR